MCVLETATDIRHNRTPVATGALIVPFRPASSYRCPAVDGTAAANHDGVVTSQLPRAAAVYRSDRGIRPSSQCHRADAVAIFIGLAILSVAMRTPGAPVVAAMALVALGATGITLSRFRGTSTMVPMMVLHLSIYSGLYALFVGAVLDAAARSGRGVGAVAASDVATGAGLLAIAVLRACRELLAGVSTR